MERPRVSIGMPVYNAEQYLEEALESLLGQTFTDLEIVISDNASSDRTEEICAKYVEKDPRVRYVRNRSNQGLYFNFNNVFRLSRGEFFKWAAADDVCGPSYLERAVEVLDGDPGVVLTWGKTTGIDEAGRPVELRNEVSDLNAPYSVNAEDPAVRLRRFVQHSWWAEGPLFGVCRADELERTGLFPRHPAGDQIVLASLLLMGRFYEIPEEVFFSRLHPKKTSHSEKSVLQLTAKLEGKAFDPPWLRWRRWIQFYPGRIWLEMRVVATSKLRPRDKLRCYAVVLGSVISWMSLRARQVAAGKSVWRVFR